MCRLNYNVHHSINYKSHRKGLVSEPLMRAVYWSRRRFSNLTSCQRPANTYGTYYPEVWGKRHSAYDRSD